MEKADGIQQTVDRNTSKKYKFARESSEGSEVNEKVSIILENIYSVINRMLVEI